VKALYSHQSLSSRTRSSRRVLSWVGLPRKAFGYKLGNRSALEWVIDQYRVTEDTRSGIKSDPNNQEDPQYILNLIGRVIIVSLQTVQIVNSLPPLAANNP
jgi:predicted helicase